MPKYHVHTSGYQGYVTMTDQELKTYIKEETTKARSYFKTAVCHKTKSYSEKGKLYFDIIARRDVKSARWLFISATPH